MKIFIRYEQESYQQGVYKLSIYQIFRHISCSQMVDKDLFFLLIKNVGKSVVKWCAICIFA